LQPQVASGVLFTMWKSSKAGVVTIKSREERLGVVTLHSSNIFCINCFICFRIKACDITYETVAAFGKRIPLTTRASPRSKP